MITHNPDLNCTNARLYYYDFLNKETRGSIPEVALQHIKQCRNCQTEMNSLKDLLVKVDEKSESEQSRKDSAISTLLRLHFEYIGEPIKCNTVKPFLGSLADPVLQIRIPTPITTHLNKCKACRDDLLTLLDLHLPHKYLCRLGQILADKPVEDAFSCSQAQAAIPALVSLAFHETNAEILKHLCTCPDCRKQLYQHRESIRKELLLNGAFQNGFPCDSVSAADIYDYCLPYGIDPADDEYVEFREALTPHLRRCPKCLAKMQELHRTISNIAERVESGVITIFDINEHAEANSCSDSESSEGIPVNSEMAGTEDNSPIEQPKTINLAVRLREKATALNIKPLLKVGLVAAAVIAIGFALLPNAPTATAVTLDQVYKAVKTVKNIYIETFVPDKAEPIQEMWVSRSLNIYMISNTNEGLVLLDTTKKHRWTKPPGRASTEVTILPDEVCTQIDTTMAGYLDLLPVENLNTDWIHKENQEVYELTWTDKSYGGSPIFRMRRYLFEPETSLPSKVEFHQKLSATDDYTLKMEMVVKSLGDDEIRAKVKEVFP
jgi:hypothetical protein